MNAVLNGGALTWSELASQPDAWSALLTRLETRSAFPRIDLNAFDEILFVGCGTSFYLAMAAADWVKRRNSVPVRAVPACEIMLDAYETTLPAGNRLAIGFSRSGESSELIIALEAMKGAGYTILSVGCTAGSSLMRLGDHHILVPEGHEDGMVMLRSFTSMLLSIQMLFGKAADEAVLRDLPAAGRSMLAERAGDLRALARQREFNRFVFLASGSSYPIAVEAGLKVQEMAIATSETYHSLEYRHGPKATADRDTLVTLFALSDTHHGLALARDLKALGVALLVVGPGSGDYADVADLVVEVPTGLSEGQASLLSLLPIQIMAYETAMRRGVNPDAPANLSKVVIFPR